MLAEDKLVKGHSMKLKNEIWETQIGSWSCSHLHLYTHSSQEDFIYSMHTYIYTVHTYTQLYIFSYYYYYYLFYWCSSIVVYIMASSECKKGAVNKGNKKRRGKEKERRAQNTWKPDNCPSKAPKSISSWAHACVTRNHIALQFPSSEVGSCD